MKDCARQVFLAKNTTFLNENFPFVATTLHTGSRLDFSSINWIWIKIGFLEGWIFQLFWNQTHFMRKNYFKLFIFSAKIQKQIFSFLKYLNFVREKFNGTIHYFEVFKHFIEVKYNSLIWIFALKRCFLEILNFRAQNTNYEFKIAISCKWLHLDANSINGQKMTS